MLADQIIGSAACVREGLYYRFRCQCQLSGDVMYQIVLICNGKEMNLGVCVPVENGFGVNTKVPVKSVGEGDLSFYVVPRHSKITGRFIPIRADEPFAYLDKLQNAHLDMQREIPGVMITDG